MKKLLAFLMAIMVFATMAAAAAVVLTKRTRKNGCAKIH